MEHPLYCRNEELVDYEFPMIAEGAEAVTLCALPQ
jgi:hypothetical protein